MLGRMMMGAVLAALGGLAYADISCPDLAYKAVEASSGASMTKTYYVLVFLGGPPGGTGDSGRKNQRRLLEERVSTRMHDVVSKLAGDMPSPQLPDVVLVTCDFPISPHDLNRNDADTLALRDVIGVLWGGTENDKASVIHLSVPYYQRRPGANRRQAEVAWLHAASKAESIDDWIKEFDRGSTAQQAFMAMGIGFMSLKHAQWELATRSLCQARKTARLMTKETVRPAAVELEGHILKVINDAIRETDEKARASGVNLNAKRSIRLACDS